MLLELAIGDAYGAGFEYADTETIRLHNNLSRYVKHPRHNIRPGCYTDDTQMSLAIAETMVSGEPWKPAVLALTPTVFLLGIFLPSLYCFSMHPFQTKRRTTCNQLSVPHIVVI